VGGGGRADVGTLRIVHFKVLVYPHPKGIFFQCKFPVFGEAGHTTGFRTLFWFVEHSSKGLLRDTALKLLSFENSTIEKNDPSSLKRY